ncbi:MAG: MoaD family protein [Anaerolineae bacterium]|nr:MoaD family protein [Anaerolineae bacterium]MDW8070470.1 MoaD family protein [Anaerolineae bacterium]
MHVTVKLFARLREVVGSGQLVREVEEGATLDDLLQDLYTQFPGLRELATRTFVALNHQLAGRDSPLHDGDEVALFPPVSGGVGYVGITDAPLDPATIIRSVIRPDTGAVATFVGSVRNVSCGREVLYLEYEAYEPMASNMLGQIVAEMRARWPRVAEIAIVQRVGRLEVGDVAVVIAVSSTHRDDGCFEACRYAIERLKQIVPIWKKEIGPDGAVWVEGDYLPEEVSP